MQKLPNLTLLGLTLLLSACFSAQPRNYFIESQQYISQNNDIFNWRQQNNIPTEALIAIEENGEVHILEETTRRRIVQRNLNPYINDFVQCYISYSGIYQAQIVQIQAPCKWREPDDDFFYRHSFYRRHPFW